MGLSALVHRLRTAVAACLPAARRQRRERIAVAALLRDAGSAAVRGDSATAERLLRAAWGTAQRLNDDALRAAVAHRLAAVLRSAGDRTGAERLAREALAAAERIRPDGAIVGNHLMFLATLLAEDGREAEALRFAGHALPIYAASLGPAHGEVGHVRSVVESLERRVGRAAAPPAPSGRPAGPAGPPGPRSTH